MSRPFRYLLAGVTLLLAACAARPPLVAQCTGQSHRARPGPALVGLKYGTQATPIPLDSVQFSNWAAERAVSVQSLFAHRTPTNTVEVVARFVSCSDRPMTLRVRTSFFNASHAPTEPVSAWKTVYLEPHLLSTYTERSMSTNVSDYLIEVTSP